MSERFTLDGGITASFAFNHDGNRLASANNQRVVKLWDLADGRELRSVAPTYGPFYEPLTFAPNDRLLASSGPDGAVRLWDADTGELRATLFSTDEPNAWLVVKPEGLFDGSEDGMTRLVAWRFSENIADIAPVEVKTPI